jgi:5-methylcytosine-specific restriction endonuclease McrA
MESRRKAKEANTVAVQEQLGKLEDLYLDSDSRVCKKCGERKPLTEFFKDRVSNGIQRYRGECKQCAIQESKKRTKRYKGQKSILVKDLTETQWLQNAAYFDNTCAYCGGSNEEREHIVPVSKGGGYTATNIIPSCKRCNASKGNTDLVTWYQQVPWFSLHRLQKIIEFIRWRSNEA